MEEYVTPITNQNDVFEVTSQTELRYFWISTQEVSRRYLLWHSEPQTPNIVLHYMKMFPKGKIIWATYTYYFCHDLTNTYSYLLSNWEEFT